MNTFAYSFKKEKESKERKNTCDFIPHHTSKRYLRQRTLKMMMTEEKELCIYLHKNEFVLFFFSRTVYINVEPT